MIVKLSSSGSFEKSAHYFTHDKGADTAERVAWTQTANMLTDDPAKAWKVMAHTALHQDQLKQRSNIPLTGRKVKHPAVSFSLSWDANDKPDKAEMLHASRDAINRLGLTDHEAIIVAHNDRPHPHVHVLVNKIHPKTGRTADLYYARNKLSGWASQYQRERGTEMNTPKRFNNHQLEKTNHEKIHARHYIPQAWSESSNVKELRTALQERHYQMVIGRKPDPSQVYAINSYGNVFSVKRHLPEVNEQDYQDRFKGYKLDRLPKLDKVQKEIITERHDQLSQKQSPTQQKQKQRDQLKTEKDKAEAKQHVNEAWQASNNVNSFKDTLAQKDYQLARGVQKNPDHVYTIDPKGNVYNIKHQLDNVNEEEYYKRFTGYKFGYLPEVEKAKASTQQTEPKSLSAAATPQITKAPALEPKPPSMAMQKQEQAKSGPTPNQIEQDTRQRFQQERTQLNSSYRQEIKLTVQEMSQKYHVKETQHEVKALQQRMSHQYRFVDRMTGKASKDQQQLHLKQGYLKNVGQQIRNQVQDIRREWKQARDTQKQRHQQEFNRMKEIVRSKPQEAQRSQVKQPQKTQGRER